jgi:hypothetical protein
MMTTCIEIKKEHWSRSALFETVAMIETSHKGLIHLGVKALLVGYHGYPAC